MTTMNTDEITSNDVLLGRGGSTNNHVGNRRFRLIVSSHQPEYLAARKKEKIAIARRIVKEVQAIGGRFLRRTNDHSWIEVPDKRATEKTSQALREGLDVRNHTIRPSKMPRQFSESALREQAKERTDLGHVVLTRPVVSPPLPGLPTGLVAFGSYDASLPDLAPEQQVTTKQQTPSLYLQYPQMPAPHAVDGGRLFEI